MIYRRRGAIASLLTASILTACAPPPVSTDSQVEEVASYLVGAMHTSARAKAIPDAPDVRMTTCKVKLADSQDNSQSIYLYQEQAMSANLSAPYRQRFLRLAPSAEGQKVESASFKPLDSKAWVGFCQKPQAERTIQTRDMEPKHCSVFFEPVENGYLGNTQSGGCPTNFRGAVKITNTIKLSAGGMDTLDRGFDGEGNLVWGAKGRPYQFRKLGNRE